LFTGLSPGPRTVPDTYSQRGRRAYWKKWQVTSRDFSNINQKGGVWDSQRGTNGYSSNPKSVLHWREFLGSLGHAVYMKVQQTSHLNWRTNSTKKHQIAAQCILLPMWQENLLSVRAAFAVFSICIWSFVLDCLA
jgi:hypothetical protein